MPSKSPRTGGSPSANDLTRLPRCQSIWWMTARSSLCANRRSCSSNASPEISSSFFGSFHCSTSVASRRDAAATLDCDSPHAHNMPNASSVATARKRSKIFVIAPAARQKREKTRVQIDAVVEFPQRERQIDERDRHDARHADRADAGAEAHRDRDEDVQRLRGVFEREAEPHRRDDTGEAEGEREAAVYDHRDSRDD